MYFNSNAIARLGAFVASGFSLFVFTGCETTSSAGYVDSKGTDTIVSLDQINIQDWESAASDMVESLLTSGALERAPSQPAILAISRIINNTTEQVDTDSLTKKIRVALSQTGKVLTTTTVGLGGRVEDPLARDSAAMDQFMNGPSAPAAPKPYFSLSGKLLEDRAKAGNVRQVTYTFQLSLTEISTGLAVWEDERQITKQGKKSAVGW